MNSDLIRAGASNQLTFINCQKRHRLIPHLDHILQLALLSNRPDRNRAVTIRHRIQILRQDSHLQDLTVVILPRAHNPPVPHVDHADQASREANQQQVAGCSCQRLY